MQYKMKVPLYTKLPISAPHLSFLLQLAEHHDGGCPVLPDHPPEVINCVLHWTLSHNVLVALLVALHTDRGLHHQTFVAATKARS